MPIYETVLIARQELTTKQVEDLTKQFSAMLTQQGGKILKTEQWGLRQLAYRISKNRKGHYVLIESECAGADLIEMERNMRLSEDVLRYMSIRLDEPSKEQSALLNKDRGEDRDTDRKQEAA